MICTIEFSHDDQRWFGYGASKGKPPHRYTLGDGTEEYEKILREWCKPYPAKFVRLVMDGQIVRHDEIQDGEMVTKFEGGIAFVTFVPKGTSNHARYQDKH